MKTTERGLPTVVLIRRGKRWFSRVTEISRARKVTRVIFHKITCLDIYIYIYDDDDYRNVYIQLQGLSQTRSNLLMSLINL